MPLIVVPFKCVTPEVMLLIKKGFGHWSADQGYDLWRYFEWGLCNEQRSRLLAAQFANTLEMSQCLLWEDDIYNAAVTGADSFKGLSLSNELVSKQMPQYWQVRTSRIFAKNKGMMDAFNLPVIDGWYDLEGIIVQRTRGVDSQGLTGRNGLLFMCIVWSNTGEHPYIRPMPIIWAGEPIPDLGVIQSFVACASFLHESIIELREPKMDRAQRRRQEKNRRNSQNQSVVRTVSLRRKITNQSRGNETDHEWHCRWLVGGHWRKQWYSATKEHKPKYIAPYVKGPENMPLKQPQPTVFVAKR